MGVDLDEPGFDVPAGRRPARLPRGADLPRRAVGQHRRRAAGDDGDQRRRCTSPSAPGVGQHVETSLAQAVINMNAMGWQRVATDAPELPAVVLRPAGAEGHLPGRRRAVAAPVGAVRPRRSCGPTPPASTRRRADRRSMPRCGRLRDERARPGRGVRRDRRGDRHPAVRRVGAPRRRGGDRAAADPVAGGGAARRAARARGRDRRARRPRARPDPPGRPRRTASTASPTRRSGRAPTTAVDDRRRRPAGVVAGATERRPAPPPDAPLDRRRRPRLRAGHRRPVRRADARRPRRHGDQGDDARVRPHRRHLRRVEPRQAGAGPRPQAPARARRSPTA